MTSICDNSCMGSRIGRDQATTKMRRIQALELRLAGHTFDEIGSHLGCRRQTAHQLVMSALDERAAEPCEKVRALELERLDKLLAAHWRTALAGDSDATEICLKVMQRRSRLLGLDAPQQVAAVVAEATGPQASEMIRRMLSDPESRMRACELLERVAVLDAAGQAANPSPN